MEHIVILATLIVAFIMFILAYERGLKNGQNMAKGKGIETIKNPVTTIIKAVESHKKEKEETAVTDSLEEMMNFDYDKALDIAKKERG